MIYGTVKASDGYEEIMTCAIDDVHDSMSFYRKGDFLTDDGDTYFECECAGWSDEKISRIMSAMAEMFGCIYNGRELISVLKNHDNGLESITQCATAVCTIIAAERMELIKILECD
jgi:hypothetical protein